MKKALLRKESVIVEGFACWRVEGPLPRNRAWRFGRIIQLKPYKVSFEIDAAALAQAEDGNWSPHPAWQVQRTRKLKLKGLKLALFLRQQAEQRYRELLRQYTRLIVKFVRDELPYRDLHQFWMLRSGGWFDGQASEVPQSEKHAVSFSEAAAVIGSTKLGDLPSRWPDGEIEAIRWYARWSAGALDSMLIRRFGKRLKAGRLRQPSVRDFVCYAWHPFWPQMTALCATSGSCINTGLDLRGCPGCVRHRCKFRLRPISHRSLNTAASAQL